MTAAAIPPHEHPSHDARMDGLDARMERLEARMDLIDGRMDRMEDKLDRLQEDVEHLKQDVEYVKQDMEYVKQDVAVLKGWGTELASRSHPEYYVRAIGLVRPRLVGKEEILTLAADAWDASLITEAELDSVGSADTYLKARRKSDREEVWVVAQVSFSVYPNDVTRAMAEAAVIGKATGETVIPAVAGERITADAAALATANRVPFVTIRNGSRLTE